VWVGRMSGWLFDSSIATRRDAVALEQPEPLDPLARRPAGAELLVRPTVEQAADRRCEEIGRPDRDHLRATLALRRDEPRPRGTHDQLAWLDTSHDVSIVSTFSVT
jgi:hypothetical protein